MWPTMTDAPYWPGDGDCRNQAAWSCRLPVGTPRARSLVTPTLVTGVSTLIAGIDRWTGGDGF